MFGIVVFMYSGVLACYMLFVFVFLSVCLPGMGVETVLLVSGFESTLLVYGGRFCVLSC